MVAVVKRWYLFLYLFLALVASGATSEAVGKVTELNVKNWKLCLKDKWVIIFTSSSRFCEVCSDLQPIWETYAKWSGSVGIQVGHVNVSHNPGIAARFMIRSLPKGYYVENGTFTNFKMPLTKAELFLFLERQSWQIDEPISSWKAPQSTLIGVVSRLMRAGSYLQILMNRLKEYYKISAPLAYLILGFGVFLFGILIGLLISMIIKLTQYKKSQKTK